ncbi:Type I phosphodiesterase/nucleotide pyrophosphatase/phosphate transferase [Penicillium cosmopolitanum]|uniref:Type I phosphodiesterase/nucleotide pyrophosphatase/phosphate transferase n=1 Tax=Penicillium cosmopolitanum TaxID=1131564 RepID=A0A9W9W6N6_9EURO|nr:Type I phosphodiesterase/nucleotide pyrophosphatase/phosphate transferase [Penicillium cosmopolitanum]KAJ5404405.1 Type I phosphodiesterase/nucleotide pyrophosphatase/phosphate transferase [Penicillium cosmopolitanum]
MPKPHALLSPSHYDNDAASLRSPSEQDSDSEDDEFLRHPRSTLELNSHDRAVLEDEDELEKLLTRRGPAHGIRRMFSPGPSGNSVRIGGESDGGHAKRPAYRVGRDGSSWDLDEKEDPLYQPPSRPHWLKLALASAVITILFFILLLGAYKASSGFRASHPHRNPPPLVSNGTALFAPTTILVSLDGFRADFLDRGITPSLNSLVAAGVSPQYMNPSFPSVTFPNHFTLVTGLYPESHGIVGNTFWDPELQEEFYYTHPAVSMLPKWWNAEPLWETAEKQGTRTAIHMWPGSEAHIGSEEPSYVDKFNSTEALSRKVNRVLELLDLPGAETSHLNPERPQFIAAYVPDVDRDGHKFGPNSTEIRATISRADTMIGGLMAGLESRNLTNVVNIVVVSDHGMATTSTERLVQLEDLVDLDLVERLDGWPSRGIRPKRAEDLPTLQKQLEEAAPKYAHAVEIYTHETMPERYHFTHNARIAPLWVIPKTGWAIVERPEFDAKKALEKGDVYHPNGIHGYDHEHPLMRAIFIARGPAFPHQPNSRVEPFQNIEVYNIMCDSLGIEPIPNNGTLRLPLKPVGLHSDEDAPIIETPSDPPEPEVTNTTTSNTNPTATTAETPEPTSAASDAPPTSNPQSDDEKAPTWWGTLWHKFGNKFSDFKEWSKELFDAEHDNHPDGESESNSESKSES